MRACHGTVSLPNGLREVRITPQGGTSQRDASIQGEHQLREQAAYERGRQESETALREQLVRQRAELAEFQGGVLESLRQAVPRLVHESEPALTALWLEVAQRIVGGNPVSGGIDEAT